MKQPIRRTLLALAAFVALTSPIALCAATATPESVARDTVLDALAPALAARGATATVKIAAPDARQIPAPCIQLIGFMPPGARLVGKTVVGVRCADGSNWQGFLSADVRIDAPIWQVTHPLRAGEPLAESDVTFAMAAMSPADIDVAAASARTGGTNGTAMRGLASLDGRTPAPLGRTVQRPVAAGRALAAADVREEGRVNAGEAVRVVYLGDGFSVSSEGRTVSAADPGSNVQIRLASGAVINGTLRAGRQVELTH
jgi:flagella basal body P-ring formation protein FlgA